MPHLIGRLSTRIALKLGDSARYENGPPREHFADAQRPPDVNGIALRIRSLLPTLTALEAGVVTGLFKKRFIDERTLLKWVADEMRVSEAMVVKIAKKLGFSGFRAFRSALAEYNNFPTTQLHAELFANDSAGNTGLRGIRGSIT